MDFLELRREIKEKLPVDEWRFELHDFCEFVIKAEHVGQLAKIFEAHFGPRQDLQHGVTPEVQAVTDRWGGVRKNQQLYLHNGNSGKEIALLWPWCDGTKISVKVIQDKPLDQSIRWSSGKA